MSLSELASKVVEIFNGSFLPIKRRFMLRMQRELNRCNDLELNK